MKTANRKREVRSYFKYLGVVLLLPLLVACGDDEEPTTPKKPDETETVACAPVIEARTVKSYKVDGSNQDIQNVTVTFDSDGKFQLILPGVETFGTSGTWEANGDCTTITLTDTDGNTLPISTNTATADQVTLTFEIKNFKDDAVPFEIVLVPPNS